MTFQDLNIIEPIQKALKEEGYKTPTPIQQQAIPSILSGKDLWACAQTGTGKTAAFAIPIIQKLQQTPTRAGRGKTVRALILAPTRELAIQINESFGTYGKYTDLKCGVVFGGIAQKYQIEVVTSGIDVLIATPGRLLDLVDQGLIKLHSIEYFVLDEADRMLDMGFGKEVNHIASLLPKTKQSLLFSATMPKAIVSLAGSILHRPDKIEVDPSATPVETINQSLYFVEKNNKINLLVSLLKGGEKEAVLVFCRTKHGADKIARALSSSSIPAEAIHGNKSQTARVTTLENFKKRKTRVLVATDVAARGIDIEGLTHVINFDLPEVAETYVHRIGRTGRAGESGFAISFVDTDQQPLLTRIERLTGKKISVIAGHAYDPKILAARKPATEEGEMTSDDYRRQKRAQKQRPTPSREQGRPTRSTYSRNNGQVQSRPSDAFFASRKPKALPSRNYDQFEFDEPADVNGYGRLVQRKEERPAPIEPYVHSKGSFTRKSFNPNFNNAPSGNRGKGGSNGFRSRTKK